MADEPAKAFHRANTKVQQHADAPAGTRGETARHEADAELAPITQELQTDAYSPARPAASETDRAPVMDAQTPNNKQKIRRIKGATS